MAKKIFDFAGGVWEVRHGQWLLSNGKICQPDIYIVGKRIYLFEVKLTYTERALEQLKRYGALLERIYSLEVSSCVVAKNIPLGGTGLPDVSGIRAFMAESSNGPFFWHLPFTRRAHG